MSTNQLANPVCDICLEPFTDPRILLCLHSFCRLCLEKELEKGPGEAITCPTCQRSIPLPEGGILALPKNLHLASEVEIAKYSAAMETSSDIKCDSCSVKTNGPSKAFCCTCREFLCQFCWDYHRASRKLQSHDTIPLTKDTANQFPSLVKPNEYCSVHREGVVKFYCGVCDSFVCQECVLDHHMDHDPLGLSAVAKDHRDELETSLALAHRSLSQVREGVAACEKRVKHMEDMRPKVTSSIRSAFEELHKALEERCEVLLGRVETLTNQKMASLVAQKETLEKLEHGLAACSEMASTVLLTNTDIEVVALKRLLPTELGSLISATPLSLKLQSDITLHVDAGLLKASIAQFGIVDSCSPAQSSWVQAHTSPPMAGTQYQLKLESRDSQGGRMAVGGLEVRAELRPNMDDQPCIRGDVEDHGDGTYTITLTPLTTGRHHLCITIHGHHILNSPCDLIVLSAGRDYGRLQTANAVISVNAPYNVAIHDNGDIYVSGGSNCIRVFDSGGSNIFTIGGNGCGEGQFYNPRGITIKGDRLYVADDSNNRVQVLTKGGKFVCKFGQMGLGPSCFNGAMDVCVDAVGRMYVADYNNHRIQVLGGDGSLLYSIPGNVPGGGAFSFPWSVALDPQGNVHVVAWDTDSVKVFSSGGPGGPGGPGAFIRMYGSLTHPTGIAIDGTGNSLVTDYGTNSLSIFDFQGNHMHTVRMLNRPYGVTVDKDGFVYVANSGTNQVLRF